MRFTLPACSAAVLLAVCSFTGSEAATISSSIMVPGFVQTGGGSNDIAIINVPDFDTTLGTLTSISASLTGSYTDTPTPDTVTFELHGRPDSFFSDVVQTSGSGPFSFSDSGTINDSADLAAFSNAGPAMGTLQFQVGAGGTVLSTGGFMGTLTYTYTPATVATVTPEPSSLVLLGTGLLGAVGALRRRWLTV